MEPFCFFFLLLRKLREAKTTEDTGEHIEFVKVMFWSRYIWSRPHEHTFWATLSNSVFQYCSIFQTDHYMWSTVCIIVFIHPHTPSKLSCGAGNVLGNHQMLCTSAMVIVTGVWFVEHLFSHLASAFLSLCESFLLSALPTPSCDYLHPVIIWQFVLQSLQSYFRIA